MFSSFCLVYGGRIYTTSTLLDVNELFNATEQNHFEKLVVSQLVKFPGLYGTQSVHYCRHKSPPFVLILSQLSPVPVIPASFCMIHFSILSSMPGFSKWSVSLWSILIFSHQCLDFTTDLFVLDFPTKTLSVSFLPHLVM